jgi:hypothetical protein
VSAEAVGQTMFSGLAQRLTPLQAPSRAEEGAVDRSGPQSLWQEAVSCNRPVEMGESNRKFRIRPGGRASVQPPLFGGQASTSRRNGHEHISRTGYERES